MSGLMSRRTLLTRRTESRAPSGPRPPWSIETFDVACDGCGACLSSCPEHILAKGADGRPVVDFARGGCTFCGDCDTACVPREGRPAAIDRALSARASSHGADRLPVLARLGASCISIQGVTCRLCGDPCDVRAIKFRPLPGGRVLPEIAEESCNGCGICVSACPVGALSMAPLVRA
ncbi:Ferredoxin [Paramagnetospirillum magneticum AMB-1]|uniref:Ferredoxin-type protein NapF n=1 Tax=Paramagnetospirillum magneticum (strain ATCC 700264 / AMB-1) TaxID=342108 RepID=Q2W3S9_PARM1|nr:Ferredoxin [Paramagnetospirillum magneticum AMB-1]